MREKSLTAVSQPYTFSGLFTLALRIVAGWTYFSAFWRRLILENKLDPDGAGYIGEKFNHFLPNALAIGPLIEYLVTHEEALWWFMLVFTIVEGVVGLLLMVGFFTRLMSIGVFALASGILLGAGWLGTTCLDEWQIGVLGIAAGFTVFLSGGGKISLDHYLSSKLKRFDRTVRLRSGDLGLEERKLTKIVLSGTAFIVFLTLFTNQYFHGGVWGKLHNLSVRPNIQISNAVLERGELSFTVYRDQGADVYGSFLIGILLKDTSEKIVFQKQAEHLSKMLPENIQNEYVAKVKPGKHSLVIPLGAKANLKLKEKELSGLPKGTYRIELVDISGLVWKETVEIN